MQSFIIVHCCIFCIYLTLGHSTWKKQSTNIVSCRQTIVICLTESSLSSWCKNWAISSGVVPSMPCSCRYWMPLFGFLLNLWIMVHRTPTWAAYLDSAFFKYEDKVFIWYMFSLRLWCRFLRKKLQDFSPYSGLQWGPRSKLQFQCSFKGLDPSRGIYSKTISHLK